MNGYTLRDRNGDLNIKKFLATFDYSLDLIKMIDIHKEVYRNKRFFEYIGQKKYSKHIINMTFDYSNKEFNNVGFGLYVKFGYSIYDIELNDNACIKGGKLIAIKAVSKNFKEKDITTDYLVTSPLSQDLLGKYFCYDSELKVYRIKGNFKTLNTVSDIRKSLYKEGFVCDGIKYVRFKRSSGSSRVGKCLFIDEKLY